MASMGNSAIIFFQMFLVLSLLLAVSMAENRLIKGFGILAANSSPECDTAYGVRAGDTCSSVAGMFNLASEVFNSINPNLNCDAIRGRVALCSGDTKLNSTSWRSIRVSPRRGFNLTLV